MNAWPYAPCGRSFKIVWTSYGTVAALTGDLELAAEAVANAAGPLGEGYAAREFQIS